MENLTLYNNLRQPPPSALKVIGAGRLKGKTDINPQWRYESITKELGPCGIGWKYEIERLWTEEGTDGQRFAFALIKFYIKDGEEWSASIPGIGGSMMITKESAGLHSSDEAYKMAVTDALSVAMKMIGTAADIYAGLWDGSKYREISNELPKKLQESQEKKPKRVSAGKKDFILVMADMLKFIGPDNYRKVLDSHKVKEAGDVTDRIQQMQIYADMQKIKEEGSEIIW